MATNKTRLGYRVISETGKSLFGFMHDECGYWTTDFQSHKWTKTNKKNFHAELIAKHKQIGVSVVQDSTVVRF